MLDPHREDCAMPTSRRLTVYIDYKSPYAFLAKDLVYGIATELPVEIDWLPYILDIPSFLGSARLDASGRVVEENRNAHQWRRVRYSYMDCRRQAKKRGLVIRGPQKIWDSRLAAAGLLFAKRQDAAVLRRYSDITFERFWKRELDIEDPATVAGALAEAGADRAEAASYLAGPGRADAERASREAEDKGVFGVPSFLLDGELFWGSEHLPDIRKMLSL
jgi:2-hydroxychromene-2-carboxylate isomerase